MNSRHVSTQVLGRGCSLVTARVDAGEATLLLVDLVDVPGEVDFLAECAATVSNRTQEPLS